MNKWISVIYEIPKDNKEMLLYLLGIIAIFITVISIGIVVNRRLKREIEAKNIIEKRLEMLSTTDELTQLYNRRFFNEMIGRTLNSYKRERKKITFAILDIDYFKQYNDTYGHLAGDIVLKEIANVLIHSLQRGDDYAFRLGGEEFGILFKATSHQEAYAYVESIRKRFETLGIEHKSSSVSAVVTASFGVLFKDALSIKDEDELYKMADDLLYRAKESGRNRVVINER